MIILVSFIPLALFAPTVLVVAIYKYKKRRELRKRRAKRMLGI